MKEERILNALGEVEEKYIEEADPERKVKITAPIWTKWLGVAACFCLVFGLAVPAIAASNPLFYNALYAISPAAAQFFKPVQMSCEDNGIRMEVKGVYIHENTAEIYITLQDLEESRLDETVDLFDGYSINTPFDCTGHCQFSSYDSETNTAAFLITIEQWNDKNIMGDKLTFSVREFLANKKTYDGIIDVNLSDQKLNSETQEVDPRGYSGNFFKEERYSTMTAIKSKEAITSPIEGTALTGIGFIDGYFHAQMYYEDIHKTDNHGFLYLKNKETGEIIHCNGSFSFFGDERKRSYQDYIFSGVTADTLEKYELYGNFVTSSGSIEGNWSITFPIKNTTE